MRFHWGIPANPGEFRFHTGTLLSKPAGQPVRMATKQFTRTEIVGMYGVSYGKFFLGWIRLGQVGTVIAEPVPWKPKRIKAA